MKYFVVNCFLLLYRFKSPILQLPLQSMLMSLFMLTLSHQTHFSFYAEDMLGHFMVKHTAYLQYQQPIGLFSARLAKHLIYVMIFWLYASLFQASEWLQT